MTDETEFPILIKRRKPFQMCLDLKFWQGFYMETYVIEVPSGTGFMSEIYRCPYKVLADAKWEKLQFME